MMASPRSPRSWARAMGPRSPLLAVEMLLFGAWGLVVPYAGRPLGLTVNTLPGIEVVDHVIPGAAVVVVAGVALFRRRRTLFTSLVATAAGGWMTATHVPLLRQAAKGQESMGAALWHSLPGMVLLAIGLLATVVDATDPGDRGAADGGRRLTLDDLDGTGRSPDTPASTDRM